MLQQIMDIAMIIVQIILNHLVFVELVQNKDVLVHKYVKMQMQIVVIVLQYLIVLIILIILVNVVQHKLLFVHYLLIVLI